MATAPGSAVTRLDQIDPTNFPDQAGRLIQGRLTARGTPPYSLCEALLTPREVNWLCEWAGVVTPGRLDDAFGHGGLIFLALLTEYNRRNSDGNSVWPGIADLFGHAGTQDQLFMTNGNPRPLAQVLIRQTVRSFDLRHVFDSRHQDIQRYYLTIQLQYGFCRQHIEQSLASWLAGGTPTEAMQRLLESGGRYQSRSFQRLMSDLKALRRDRITEIDVRGTLAACRWVLPEWHDLLIEIAKPPDSPDPSDEAEDSDPTEPPPEILDRPRIEWDGERGPVACCRLRDLVRPTASRYHLRQEGRLLASWFRQADGRYLADRTEVELATDRPLAAVALEDETGATVLVQMLSIWDDAEDVAALPVGRMIEPGQAPDPARPFTLVLREGFRASDDGLEWWLSGPADDRRRWVLVAEPKPGLRVVDRRGNIAWQAGASVPRPSWVDQVRVDRGPPFPHFTFGEDFHVTIAPPPEVTVESVVLNGQPLRFTDATRRRTWPIPYQPEHAIAGGLVRVGLSRQGAPGVLRVPLGLPTRGLVEFRRDDEGASDWRSCPPNDPITVEDAGGRPFRVFTDGPDALLEGHVYHRRIDPKRPRPLGRLLGTGGRLTLATGRFSPTDEFPVAGFAIDRGLVEAVADEGGSSPGLRLWLARPLAPTEGRQVILWSDRHDPASVGAGQVRARDGGREWVVPLPWADEPGHLLAAIADGGYRLGFGSREGDDLRAFFSAGPDAGPGLSARQRLALARWFRLPALMPDPKAQRRPVARRLAEGHPADAVAVAFRGRGLDELPGGLRLRLSDAADARMASDAIARELLFDFRPSRDQADAIAAEFVDGSTGASSLDPRVPLLLALPLLAARVLQAGWLATITQRGRPEAREQLRRLKLAVAGLDLNATGPRFEATRDAILERARTTLGEGVRSPHAYLIEGLARAAWHSVLNGRPYEHHERRDLLVALDSAAFRQYLALRLLHGLWSQY